MSSLPTALQSCDMLLIDGLHAFDFTFDDAGLVIECMDGRLLKRWHFDLRQLAAAVATGDEWVLGAEDGEHRLICMSALRASEDEDDE
ncbi:DUF5629 family protein [Pseudomonas capeferrum]|uniref:DUF5629 family protein n=1 Tax=Pseudomonas capeferrum TaxID=1495066 RepID=UPI0015E3FB82|nr:DUF5629 family protein [Pseudomonas capeferrum]MBA1202143.1 DUF5629 family protein [Pseudomonas capeferrum]